MQLPLFTVRKRIFGHFPWGCFTLLMIWSLLGLVNLYSATYRVDSTSLPILFKSQLIWFVLGLLFLFFMTLFDYHWLEQWAYPFYGISIFLLLLVFVFGRSVAGQQNWVSILGFSFQPSEIAKLALILVLSKYFSSYPPDRVYGLKELLPAMGLTFIPLILVILQKDLGGSIFFVLLFASMSFFLKVKLRMFVVAALIASLASVFAYNFVLKNYQKDRVKSFMNPEADAKGRGYHLVQSKIAVGSGGLLGRGYLKGNINKLKFLPERHTDFIFPVLAEEWGFVGSFILILSMSLFLFLGLDSASQCKDFFGALLAVGVVSLLFWNIVINLGGVLGLMPLTGVPLPLMSYGGSSLVTMLMAIGVLFNVRMRRFVF